jgi:hypothetical protein
MKEQAVLTLTPFAQLSNRGRTEVKTAAVPEPSTWAMMLPGFVGLATPGSARRGPDRQSRSP